jgi:aspartate kinase
MTGSTTPGDRMRVVAKFGGTSLGTGERIARAADSVAAAVEAGHQITVVASAMGSTTDDLLGNVVFDAPESDRAEIVSMGERTSIRMLKAALAARGVEARFLEPGAEGWPVLTDAEGEVDVEHTRERALALADDLDDCVPVVAGFLAEGPDGEVVTLGRGGSDTTAMMLGQYMDADEVVIVTDVEGVMTGDPRVVEGARNVAEISIDELRDLSLRGAEVIAPSALTYKDDDLTVRVMHYQHDDLLTGGTRVEGEFDHLVDLRERPLACVTVAGRAIRNRPGILQELSTALGDNEVNIDAVASGMDSVTFYVDAAVAEEAEAILHREVVDRKSISSVSVDGDVAVVRVTGGEFPNQPGVLSEVVQPLADAGVTIRDVITSAASLAVFVDWADREQALEIMQEAF